MGERLGHLPPAPLFVVQPALVADISIVAVVLVIQQQSLCGLGQTKKRSDSHEGGRGWGGWNRVGWGEVKWGELGCTVSSWILTSLLHSRSSHASPIVRCAVLCRRNGHTCDKLPSALLLYHISALRIKSAKRFLRSTQPRLPPPSSLPFSLLSP